MANENRIPSLSALTDVVVAAASTPARAGGSIRHGAVVLALAALAGAMATPSHAQTPVSSGGVAAAAAAASTAGNGAAVSVQGTLVPPGQARSPARPALQPTLGCLISPLRVADIGSPVTGVVSQVHVDVGDAVRRTQVLVTLRNDVEMAGEQAAHQRWSLEADLRAAESQLVLARQRHSRATELLSEGFVSPQAVEQARAEMQVAEQRVAQSSGQRDVLARDLGVARAQVEQRIVRAPFDGVVVERWRHPGERVEERPMLRVATLDPLRVDLVVPASRFGQYTMNEAVTIRPDLPGAIPVAATVTHVDRVIDAASNTYRVRLNLPNPGHRLPAGARCALDGGAAQAAQATPAAAAPRAAPNAPGAALAPVAHRP
jgi:membrane fusion protein, heavy metal efflux system